MRKLFCFVFVFALFPGLVLSQDQPAQQSDVFDINQCRPSLTVKQPYRIWVRVGLDPRGKPIVYDDLKEMFAPSGEVIMDGKPTKVFNKPWQVDFKEKYKGAVTDEVLYNLWVAAQEPEGTNFKRINVPACRVFDDQYYSNPGRFAGIPQVTAWKGTKLAWQVQVTQTMRWAVFADCGGNIGVDVLIPVPMVDNPPPPPAVTPPPAPPEKPRPEPTPPQITKSPACPPCDPNWSSRLILVYPVGPSGSKGWRGPKAKFDEQMIRSLLQLPDAKYDPKMQTAISTFRSIAATRILNKAPELGKGVESAFGVYNACTDELQLMWTRGNRGFWSGFLVGLPIGFGGGFLAGRLTAGCPALKGVFTNPATGGIPQTFDLRGGSFWTRLRDMLNPIPLPRMPKPRDATVEAEAVEQVPADFRDPRFGKPIAPAANKTTTPEVDDEPSETLRQIQERILRKRGN